MDGGKFSGSDFSRTTLFARALSFANTDKSKNFAYVDFEDDFNVSSIQDAAQAFGVKIIRSHHNMTGPVSNMNTYKMQTFETIVAEPVTPKEKEVISHIEMKNSSGATVRKNEVVRNDFFHGIIPVNIQN